MEKIEDLENQYGKPDILIDSSNDNSTRYAIWGFDEVFKIYQNSSYLNDKLISGEPLENFQKIINKWKKSDHFISCIGFLSYELNEIIYNHLNFQKRLKENDFPLLWFCKPKLIREYKLDYSYQSDLQIELKKIDDIIDYNSYSKDIEKIKNYLKNGDVYQINYTSHKSFESHNIDTYDLYKKLRYEIKPKEGFYIHSDDFDILSFSPELFLKIKDQKISTFPIKGTRPSSNDRTQDSLYKLDLKNSLKDKAEHLMIVDLLRNDLGKICQTGSVQVNDLYKIETFKTVHHMVSKVYGKLKDNISEIEIIKALFPGGSITGAPKESAMKIINLLESNKRNIYTGSAGYICKNGDMYFNICIRTLLKYLGVFEYGIGGGIVWDSDPKDEWEEANQKSKILELI